jgi:hypothetical protein
MLSGHQRRVVSQRTRTAERATLPRRSAPAGAARPVAREHHAPRRTRGAVYVEFLVAFLPVLTCFECLLQLAGLQAARLVTQHAATCAARAAAVVLHDDPAHYGGVAAGSATGARRRDVERAAALVLRAVDNVEFARVSFPAGSGAIAERSSFGPDEVIRIQVSARYHCSLPLARSVVCGFASSDAALLGEASLPGHGARYEYE